MARTFGLTAARPMLDPVLAIRIALIVSLMLAWELLSWSGLLYRDVVPSLTAIAGAALRLWFSPDFYWNLLGTAQELGVALLVGGALGLATGLVLGGNAFMGQAFERYVYYLAPTPKIIFFPMMIMWFGVGPGSKMAMGALSCFFPIALSTAVGMRGIAPIFLKVGRSFRLNGWQMITKVALPAMRVPVIDGIRLGVGIAIIGVLLAETKLSNRGLGFMVIRNYQRFDMPSMYALIGTVFAIAIIINWQLGRLAQGGRPLHSP